MGGWTDFVMIFFAKITPKSIEISILIPRLKRRGKKGGAKKAGQKRRDKKRGDNHKIYFSI